MKNPAPHAAAPIPTPLPPMHVRLEDAVNRIDAKITGHRQLLFNLADLFNRMERRAEDHGVREFTGNSHLLFANEILAIIPEVLRPQFDQDKIALKEAAHEKEEEARRRREAKLQEKEREEREEGAEGEAEQG